MGEFCDKLSKSGHLVIMPDYFRGNPWPLDADPMDPDNKFMEWLPDFNNVHKDTEDVIKYMKEFYGPEKMALLGFCWVVRLPLWLPRAMPVTSVSWQPVTHLFWMKPTMARVSKLLF